MTVDVSVPDPGLIELLRVTVESGSSDLHLTVGRPPTVRRDGRLLALEGVGPLSPADTERMVTSLLNPVRAREFGSERQVDFSFGLSQLGRFRANAYQQRNAVALALRVVPARIRPLHELGAPPAAEILLSRPYGLVLVVGPTGSGKSTTLAAMIDRINTTAPVHILTIEDPIEYVHQHQVAMVNQREVGTDVASFEDGLRSALREDPDVILLGEMRDLESIRIALSLAETGHLVFATLHTNDAAQALDRVIDVFPGDERAQIATLLSGSLQGVMSQRLLPGQHGGRVAAYEVLIANDPIRNLLREGKSRQIRNVISTSHGEGMQTLEMDLARLVVAGMISMDVAQGASAFPREVQAQLGTARAQAGAAGTIAAGQSATMGSGQVATPGGLPPAAPPVPSPPGPGR